MYVQVHVCVPSIMLGVICWVEIDNVLEAVLSVLFSFVQPYAVRTYCQAVLRALCMEVAILYSAPFTLHGTAVLSQQDRTFVSHSSSSSSITAVLSLTLLEVLRWTCNRFVLFPTHQTVPDHTSRWSSVTHDGVACLYICPQTCTDLTGPVSRDFGLVRME